MLLILCSDKRSMKCYKCGIQVDGGRRRLIQHKRGYHSY